MCESDLCDPWDFQYSGFTFKGREQFLCMFKKCLCLCDAGGGGG